MQDNKFKSLNFYHFGYIHWTLQVKRFQWGTFDYLLIHIITCIHNPPYFITMFFLIAHSLECCSALFMFVCTTEHCLTKLYSYNYILRKIIGYLIKCTKFYNKTLGIIKSCVFIFQLIYNECPNNFTITITTINDFHLFFSWLFYNNLGFW